MIRAATVGEADTLTELALRSKAHWGYSEEFVAACRDELTVRPADLESHRFTYRVLERDGAVLGFYSLERLSEDEFELEALFVEPSCIGSGLGRELFSHAVALAGALGGQSMLIQSDPHASEFYRGVGARQVGMRASDSIPGRELPVFEMALLQ